MAEEKSEPGFSPWQPLTAPLPAGPGVVQVKMRGGLLDLPRGKSAMVLYAAAPDLEAWRVEGAAAIEDAAREAGVEAPLVCRFELAADAPVRLARLLDGFVRRFGAPPRLNATRSSPAARSPRRP